MQSIKITSLHTEQTDLSNFPAFPKARRRAIFSSTLPYALTSSYMRFPIFDGFSEERL